MAFFNHIVDTYNKQGKVIVRDPYRMVVDSQGKRYERPPGSGKWYAPDGSLIKDESAAIEAQKAKELEAREAAEAQRVEFARLKLREELKAELKAELIAEQGKAHKKG